MNDNSPNSPNTDKTVPAHSVPPVSSGMYGQGSHLLQSGMMLPPQSPGVLGVIGKYQVIKILGEGGMGQVVLAREPVTDSMVAIKLIKPEFLNKSWAVHRFLTEARHMFRMSHGSIIRVLDVSDRAEGPYFVMPFMSGGSLADKIKPGEPLQPETILPVARAVAEALQHAHTRGITHRDLKPSNILLDAEGKAQLADFGLLRTFLNDTLIDASQPQMEGTVPYMSPAVAAGKAEDTRCDIYAFGCLLYEMLTGQPPYQGPTVDAVLKQIQDGPPPPIRQLNPQSPAALTAIADHAMARELRDRYASMADVVAELERVAQGKELIGTHGKVVAKPKNKTALLAAAAVVIVGLAAFGISQLPVSKNAGTAPGASNPTSVVPPVVDTAKLPFTYKTEYSEVTITKYTGPGGEVTIPDKINGVPVTTIGEKAFYGCLKLTKVTIPNSITTIKPEAFSGCVNLASLMIPNSVTAIGMGAFGRCEALTSLTIPGSVTTLEKAVFIECRALRTITLADGVTSIGTWAFAHCTALNSITIPNSVTRIEDWAFENCSSLIKITIPASVTSIGENGIFRYCSGLSSITVDPANPAYSNTPDGVMFDKKMTRLLCYPGGRAGSYVIPDGVTKICGGAFHGSTSLITVTVPKGVTAIDYRAFRRCSELTALYFQGDAPTLGPDVFSSTPKATIYYLPTTKGWGKEFGGRPTAVWDPKAMPKDAPTPPSVPVPNPTPNSPPGTTPPTATEGDFSYTVKDGAVTIVRYTGTEPDVKVPDKIKGMPVTEIGPSAFSRIKLTRVALPAGLIRLGHGAFDNCGGLTHVEIPSTVTDIGNYAFRCCYALGSITIPASVTRIGDYAFAICTSLPSITIPASVTNIGGNAFFGCTKLTRVTIPASVTTIGPDPFSACSALVEISVDEANPAYCSADGVLCDKKNSILLRAPEGKAGTYNMPADFTKIGPGAFTKCTKLTGVTIPNSVTEIGTNAFSGCTGLSSINIPASVSSIVGVPFSGCSALTAIAVDAANPFLSSADGVLFNKQKTVLIRCPGNKAGHYAIPDGVTKISPSAFADCANLSGIALPETVTEIGIGAFARCIGLTTITIPARVNQIYRDAFSGCDRLISIKVDAAHPTYSGSEDGVLFSKDKIKLVRCPPGKTGRYVVPDSVTSIEDSAFIECANLTEITIPDSVVQIGSSAFTRCARLNRVEIGKGVRSIGSYAFAPCSSLTSAMFYGDAPKGDTDATIFYQDRNATVCYLPETKGWGKTFATVRTALWDAKLRCCYTTDKDGATLTKYIGPGGDVVIPGKIGGLPVVRMAEAAFQNCATLTSLTVPEGVKSIMGRAFDGCTGLTKVTLPASVTSLGIYPAWQWNPFVNCPKLAAIRVDAANPAFRSNTDGILFNKEMTVLLAYPGGRAGSYTIPDSVTSIGLGAFEGCAELTEGRIHRAVTTFGRYTSRGVANPFFNCPKLTSIAVDEANAAFSSDAAGVLFSKDRTTLFCYPSGKGSTYTVPDGVTRIGDRAFAFCPGLAGVTIPASLTSIGHEAFINSGELAAIFFKGHAPTSVGGYAFQGADKATIYYLPTAKGWGKEFGGRPTAVSEPGKDSKPPLPQTSGATPEPLTEGPFTYTVKDGAVTITKYTGPGGDVKIPDKIKGMPVTGSDSAFRDCTNLTSVTIPNTVKTIASFSFSSCTALMNPFIPASVTNMGSSPFIRCNRVTSITVDAKNPNYSSEDGIVFNKEKTSLFVFPAGRTGSYTVPGSVKQINGNAFRDCQELTGVTLPPGVEVIAFSAFSRCPMLSGVYFNGAAPSIGAGAFNFCNATIYYLPTAKGWGKEFGGRPTAVWDAKSGFCHTIEAGSITIVKYIGPGGDVAIPDKIGGLPVTSIAESAFHNYTNLTSLTVSEGIKSIMGGAFGGCTGLTKVTLPASVTSLGTYPKGRVNPFANCPKLFSITVAGANPAFRSDSDGILFNKEMTALLAYPGGRAGSYTIPDSVTSVGLAAFMGCAELTEVRIHRGVTALGLYAQGITTNPFSNCPKLTSIAVDETNASFCSGAGVVFNKERSALFCYPGGKPGAYIVPDGVTRIGESAFASCLRLSSVTMPASVSIIGYVAFLNSGELTGVYFKGNAPTGAMFNAFEGADKATIYYLPTTKGWGKEFCGRPTAVWDPKKAK